MLIDDQRPILSMSFRMLRGGLKEDQIISTLVRAEDETWVSLYDPEAKR